MPTPLQTLTPITDGTIPTATSWFSPFYNAAKSLVGAAGGNPDANNGGPVLLRSHQTALHSFTNAQGTGTNPGVSAAGLGGNVTVGAGLRILILSIFGPGPGTIQLNSSVSICTVRTTASVFFGLPIPVNAGVTINFPANTGGFGLTVNSDAAISPVVANVTNASTYTVTAGKTLWLYGCFNTNGAQNTYARLLVNSSNPLLSAYAGNNAGGTDNAFDITSGSALWGQAPIPLTAGLVLSSSSATSLCIWGVEI